MLQSKQACCDSFATGTGSCTHRANCDSVATGFGGSPCVFERRSLLEELEGRGIRMTVQRRVLVEVIQQADQHLDAATLLELARAREPRIDRATVYRTLELLKSLRLIDELDLMHLQGEKHFYEVKTRRDHIHLACFQCGGIEEFSSDLFERLKSELSRQAGFDVKVARLEVGGRCQACLAKSHEKENAATA